MRGHARLGAPGKAPRQSAEEMLSIAVAAKDQAMLLIAHSALGNVTWYMGENCVALDNLIRAEAVYEEPAHASLTVGYGQDFGRFHTSGSGATYPWFS